jgi:hypothetical protein
VQLLHSLGLMEGPGFAALPVLTLAFGVRMFWRRGKTALQP